jgi:large subunit ribosomal protein L23
MNLHDIIQGPLITEKASTQKDDHRTLSFKVALDANKTEIKKAVEKLFGVKVEAVRTSRLGGKLKRYVARRREDDRVLRGSLIDDASQEIQPHFAR